MGGGSGYGIFGKSISLRHAVRLIRAGEKRRTKKSGPGPEQGERIDTLPGITGADGMPVCLVPLFELILSYTFAEFIHDIKVLAGASAVSRKNVATGAAGSAAFDRSTVVDWAGPLSLVDSTTCVCRVYGIWQFGSWPRRVLFAVVMLARNLPCVV
jgi:hypothetical protein